MAGTRETIHIDRMEKKVVPVPLLCRAWRVPVPNEGAHCICNKINVRLQWKIHDVCIQATRLTFLTANKIAMGTELTTCTALPI